MRTEGGMGFRQSPWGIKTVVNISSTHGKSACPGMLAAVGLVYLVEEIVNNQKNVLEY